MITIHQGNCPTQCSLALRPMFEERKRLFVDLLGWQVSVVAGQYEIDQFDSRDCVYLVDSEAGDPHLGSLRLLPTDRPHLLGKLFPMLCDIAAPSGPTVCEITRLCLPSRLGAAKRLQVRNRLISAMVDHALATGIATLTGVVEKPFLEQIMDMGWSCRPLGAPLRLHSAQLGAFRIEIDEATPEALAANGIYTSGTILPPAAQAA